LRDTAGFEHLVVALKGAVKLAQVAAKDVETEDELFERAGRRFGCVRNSGSPS
jgi:hypothetical protein